MEPASLRRHFGLLESTALNVTMIVGAGVFITIPLMLKVLPGYFAIAGWLVAGILMLVDGLIWSELGAALPGSGGSYLYLLECYGRRRWGRFMAFLFIWQFLISGPLEIASGLIAINQFSNSLNGNFAEFNRDWTWKWSLGKDWDNNDLIISFGPSRLVCMLIGVGLVWLLYRRINILGKLTITFWLGVMAVITWILVAGWGHFQFPVAFYLPPWATKDVHWASALGPAMILAMYSYLGYYNVCYIGDEVRDPGRTLPRAIVLSAILVCALFVGLHLAMMGTVDWTTVPTEGADADTFNLAATFMGTIYGDKAVVLVTILLIWSCMGSAFAALLGYSRIPYGAARYGHFFAPLARVHPLHHIPHVSLLLIGALTLFWTVFDLGTVINALITTRILEQFVGQVVGLVLLRRFQPDRVRPFKMSFYLLPCGIALVGWLYMYISAGLPFIVLGLVTLGAGMIAFTLWQVRKPKTENLPRHPVDQKGD